MFANGLRGDSAIGLGGVVGVVGGGVVRGAGLIGLTGSDAGVFGGAVGSVCSWADAEEMAHKANVNTGNNPATIPHSKLIRRVRIKRRLGGKTNSVCFGYRLLSRLTTVRPQKFLLETMPQPGSDRKSVV